MAGYLGPPDVAEFGTPLKTYFTRRYPRCENAILALLGIGVGTGIVITYATTEHYREFLTAGIGMAVAIFLFSVYCAYVALYPPHVVTYRDGIAYCGISQKAVFRWVDVESIKIKAVDEYVGVDPLGVLYVPYGFQSRTLKIRRSDGVRIVLNHQLMDWDELGQTVLNATYPHMLERAIASYFKGEMVRFGRVRVNRDGFRYDWSKLNWSDIQKLEVFNGRLTVRKKERWFRWAEIPLDQIVSYHVLFGLMNEVHGIRPSGM